MKMRFKFDIITHNLNFNFEAGTSRGILKNHRVYFLKILSDGTQGIGEIAPLKGLSVDFKEDMGADIKIFSTKLIEKIDGTHLTSENINQVLNELDLNDYPSIRFGFEVALLDLLNGGTKKIFECSFLQGSPININGLLWMGNKEFMLEQLKQKIALGFTCIKMKVGAIELQKELEVLDLIRSTYSSEQIEIRVDANGAFDSSNVFEALEQFSKFEIHSIEQPIKPGQSKLMTEVCGKSPIPVALDEELIGINDITDKQVLLKTLKPKFVILKPTLLGGFLKTQEWIDIAEQEKIGWWMTSALESNIGLNAIAQYASHLKVTMPQGLGTGSLYSNNIESPLTVSNGKLEYVNEVDWAR